MQKRFYVMNSTTITDMKKPTMQGILISATNISVKEKINELPFIVSIFWTSSSNLFGRADEALGSIK